tara:strand:- start:2152 stop:2685 length:534 start_codon:yes stop_codon:yes gene_type:complete
MSKIKLTLTALALCSTLALSACSNNIIKPDQKGVPTPKLGTPEAKVVIKNHLVKEDEAAKINKASTAKVESHSFTKERPKTMPSLHKSEVKHGVDHKAHYQHKGADIYTIKSGDTLSDIASQHTLTLKDEIKCLKAANKLNTDDSIIAGKTLYIPSAKLCREVYLGTSAKSTTPANK